MKRVCKIFLAVDQIVSYSNDKAAIETHSILADETSYLVSMGLFAFFVVDTNKITVFTREKIVRRMKKRRESSLGGVNGAAPADTIVEPPPKEFSNFVKYRQVDMRMWIAPRENGTASPAVAFEYDASKNLLVFAFEDGSVKIIACNFLSEVEHSRNAKLLCDFSAHTTNIRSLTLLSFTTCHGDAYMIEFISVGVNNELRHWAVRASSQEGECIPEQMGVKMHNFFENI